MKRFAWLAIVAALMGCGGAMGTTTNDDQGGMAAIEDPPPGPVTPPSADEARLFADSTNAFAVDLWHQLREEDGNLAVSPASISVALAMTWGGARGATADQMASVMHFGDDADAFHQATGAVLSTWNDTDRQAYELAVANRLFGEQTYTWQDQFLALTEGTYRAPLEATSFRGSPEPSRRRINDWVAGRTNDRIRDLIPEGAINSDTRLVLTNAVYFRADWASQFEANDTYETPFHAASGSHAVPTMHQTNRFGYGEVDGARLLEMPYTGGDLSMLVALPETRDGLDALEASLSTDAIASWSDAMQTRLVRVALPKFRVDPAQPLALRRTLMAMGMSDAFDPESADFSRMADPAANEGLPLFISAVFHKAFVAVDEEGTEAAAATAVVMAVETAAMEPPDAVEFTADHPFLFFIRDNQSGAILFMGRVATPA